MTTSFSNSFGITKIILNKKIHCYCRLGHDWYTNQLTISFTPVKEIPDYVFLDKDIEEQCEKGDLLIEELVSKISDIIMKHAPSAKNVEIKSYVDDSVPKNMQVTVIKNS